MRMTRAGLWSVTPRWMILGAAMVALAGCGDKTPTGQVVASVDGDDITRRDVMTELQASKAPAGVDIKAVQPIVTEQIVDRKLLVEQAKKEGVDKTPDFLAAKQRGEELLLAQQLVAKWASQLSEPSAADLQTFIDSNPQMFANRKLLELDQIRTSAAGIDPKQLEPMTSMDQIIAFLNSKSHPFRRGHGTIDTLTIPKKAYDQLEALPPGMPFVNIGNGELAINAVIGSQDTPVQGADQNTIAKAAMKQQAIGKSVSDQVKSLKAGAKIEYQPGYAPPAKTGTAG